MELVIQLMGGLGLFIAGINMMGDGIEEVIGKPLRNFVEKFTKNKLLGLVFGFVFTALVQSSTAALDMVVSFVDSSLMTLGQAAGIIIGANIGTTITALLASLDLSIIAPILVLIGAIIANFTKKIIHQKTGEIILGFGILFMGIGTMSYGFEACTEIPRVMLFFDSYGSPILAFLVCGIITFFLSSSSITVSILVVMCAQGLVDLNLCMYAILGCNIGSCSAALLSTDETSDNAKRTALFHFLFNLFGTILLIFVIVIWKAEVKDLIYMVSGHGTDVGTLGRNVAFAHILFKLIPALVFYPLISLLVSLTSMFIPDVEEELDDSQYHLEYIGPTLPNPTVAILVAVREMERMAYMAIDNINLALDCLLLKDEKKIEQVYETERYIDFLNRSISEYLVKINQNTLPVGDAKMISAYFNVLNDIERIGDHAENIVEIIPDFAGNDLEFPIKSAIELKEMMNVANRLLKESINMFVTGNMAHMDEIKALEEEIDQTERNLQTAHIRRLERGDCSPEAGIFFTDVVSDIERVCDHGMNIAFALVEARQIQED
ncbi:MAG: Na/Pi cotransporter family protein [Lachnospiraceae bacterium]|nr:Na/Pi cotransporter family protein [Lachnospiraceae bacterium]